VLTNITQTYKYQNRLQLNILIVKHRILSTMFILLNVPISLNMNYFYIQENAMNEFLSQNLRLAHFHFVL